MTTTESQLDASELEQRAKSMYEQVALESDRGFRFETGKRTPPIASSPS